MAGNKKRTPNHEQDVSGRKQPKNYENPDSWLGKKPTWRFSTCDQDVEKWNVLKCTNFHGDILDKLISFEGMTWSEIQTAAGGRSSGTNSHFIPLDQCVSAAQARAEKLQIESIFSLRLTGTKRLFGTINNGTFNVVWYTDEHDICKSKKKHT